MNSANDPAIDFLFSRINYERSLNMPYDRADLKLERMAGLLELAGHPERNQKIVHIAGTKGKGSTSHLLASILTSAGYRTGRFTSPHLHRIEERFAVDGHECSTKELIAYIEQLRPIVEMMDRQAEQEGHAGPTYFELTTAIALMHFAARKTDYTILEVGLGGRLDSTNVCQPIVSVITNISFDHMRQLGNSLALIAREKAGIIKPGIPVISGVVPEEPRTVIREVADTHGCRLIRLARDFDVQYHSPARLDSGHSRIDYFHLSDGERKLALSSDLGLLGQHQAASAAVAIAVSEQLNERGARITHNAIRQGLANARCPARIEIVQTQPVVVLDAAHNGASIDALCDVLSEGSPIQPRCLIVAMTRGKEIEVMLRRLIDQFDTVICTRYLNNPRCQDPEEVASCANKLASSSNRELRIVVEPDPVSAWQNASQATPSDGLICVTGSFFIAAEVGQLIRQKRDPGAIKDRIVGDVNLSVDAAG